MTIPIAKIWHKKIAIVLVGLLMFANIFPMVFVQAETNSKEIYYADQDYITVKANQRQGEYLLSIDSKNLGALDWVGYVFRLKPEEFKSLEDFQQKVKNNRIVYLDERETIGMVYATAKSVFRYLDVLSTVIDFAAKKIFGTAIIDTVNLPANESSIYLIRAYSGSWGKLNDSGEKSFVREKLTGGKARDDQALALNLFTIVLDVASLIIPFDKTLTPDDLQKIATAGLIEVSHKFGQPDFMQGGANGKDLYQLAVGGAAAMFKEFFNLLKDEASKKFIKLAIRNSQLAVNLVNLSDKVSKGGKIADRIFQLLTLATPLETSYLTVNNAVAKLAKESKNKEQLFFAKISTGQKFKIDIAVFDPDKEAVISTKELQTPTFSLYGTGEQIQYDQTTQNIYLSEAEGFLGPGLCQDNECYSRILQSNISGANLSLGTILETTKELTNFLVIPGYNTILLSLDNAQSGKKEISTLNLKTKAVTKIGEIDQEDINNKFILAKNRNLAYHVAQAYENNKWALYFYRIDLENKIIAKDKIYEAKGMVSGYTNISSDEQLIAFYVEDENKHDNLLIYNLETKSISQVPYNGVVSNIKLIWSGQGRKLLYDLKNKLGYYNFDTGENVNFITGDNITIYHYREGKKTSTKELGGYVYGWSPTDKYILYSIKNGDDVQGYKERAYLFDTEDNRTIALEGDIFQMQGAQGTWVSASWHVTE